MSRRDQLPLEAVRDLLGITRALFAAWKRDAGVSKPDLTELEAVGKQLKDALALARRTECDTVGHRAAWDKAEDACARLCRLISVATPIAPTIEAAAVRIRRIGAVPTKREARAAAEKWRR
jgi:hypothetical protein